MNQTPEQRARDLIDAQLVACGWVVQDKARINLHVGLGVAVREYPTEVGPADYVLFVGGEPVGVVEAKREEEGVHLTWHEDQAEYYAGARLKHLDNRQLPFVYVSTGAVTRFTDLRDPKPRTRPVFAFHRPETLGEWLGRPPLRETLTRLPALDPTGLRACQVNAITRLEASFAQARPRALVQMTTGSGKTFTAITFVYRLLKHTGARRVLFLVDTKNLGEQAEQEFMAYLPNDDNRKFTELYGVHRLRSRHFPTDCQVYISTIQRLYAALKGEELEESAEEQNPAEQRWQPPAVPPVAYDPRLPVEFFDFIVIDECHRSIYNLWMQVLDYFDAFQVGLTATPDARTFAYFQQNVVSEYSHELAVADGVNVGYDVFLIDTRVSTEGGTLWKGAYVERRERLSRRRRLEQQDEDEAYSRCDLDRDVVNPSQIRTIIRTFREQLPAMFPDRLLADGTFEVPKTLIFAKTDSHADDIIQIVREEFCEQGRFCRKITYKAEDDPKSVLAAFRNDYHPRIAVTVDMIATGTDVKPLECLLFMRDVKSRNYFEQMKGRGTRVIPFDDLRKVSPAARAPKDHFVIVDAIGVTRSLKTDSRPLERKPGVPLADLLSAVAVGARDEDLFTSLANRLTRLDRRLSPEERAGFTEKAGGRPIPQVVRDLLDSYDPDVLEAEATRAGAALPADVPPEQVESAVRRAHDELRRAAARPFTGELNAYLEQVRRAHEQKIDLDDADEVLHAGWAGDAHAKAAGTVAAFSEWVTAHRDEFVALRIFYGQPYQRRDLTFAMVRDLVAAILRDKPALAPLTVWRAYEQLERVSGQCKNEFVALVALVRRVAGIDAELTAYDRTVDRNFQRWLFAKQAGPLKFTREQMEWLTMLKDQIATSVHVALDDLDYTPFDARGGRGRMWQLFGEDLESILAELNEALGA